MFSKRTSVNLSIFGYGVICIVLMSNTFLCYSQNTDRLTEYINSCKTVQCLDTIYSLDLQSYLNDTQKAKLFLKSALEKAQELNHVEIFPKINTELARLFYYQGEYDSSFFYRIKGIKQLEKQEQWPKAGMEYAELGYQYKRINLSKAFSYMQKGIDLLEEAQDKARLADAYNNYGVLHEMDEKFDSALFFYQSSLAYKIELNDSLGIPYSLENIGIIQITQENYDKAEDNLMTALKFRIALNDQQGLLINYINLGELYRHKKNYQKAISYFKTALDLESKMGNPYAAQYCHEKLTEVYQITGNYKKALDSHIQYVSIKDSISNEQNIKNVEALTIAFETEKKEQEIELLSVENELKASEIQSANNRLIWAISLSVLLLLSIFLLFNRYKHKQKALLIEEKANNQKLGFKSLIEGEEKERKRIARELHDGLGQILSTARLNISALEDMVNEGVLKQWQNSIKLVDDAVTEVRHISHNMMPNALISIGFESALKEQIHIINDAGKVKVHTEFPDEKIKIEESEAIALYRIIQELLNNALKYAEAKNIWLVIKQHDAVEISIKDDGKGFDTNQIDSSNGIGWQNIKSRIELLNGQLNLDSKPGVGSRIYLKIAV